MQKEDFTTTLLVDQSPEIVFNAICDVASWWTGEPGVEGSAGRIGDEFSYRYNDLHYSKQKITDLVPGKKIVWMVTDSELSFIKDKNEWTGTHIIFEIFERQDKTEVCFTHSGLDRSMECYRDCSNAWSSYIKNSLKKYIEEAKVPRA